MSSLPIQNRLDSLNKQLDAFEPDIANLGQLSDLQKGVREIKACKQLTPEQKKTVSLAEAKLSELQETMQIVMDSSFDAPPPQARPSAPMSAPYQAASAAAPKPADKAVAPVGQPNQSHPGATTVVAALHGARQYDAAGNRPSACTFHSLVAMAVIGHSFQETANAIRAKSSEKLSSVQKQIIQDGLALYERAKIRKPDLREGADLDHIRNVVPEGLRLGKTEDEVDGSFDRRLNAVVNFLYTNNEPNKVVWVKNGNEESFAVIKKGADTIIFDSHKNEMILTQTKDSTKTALSQKLLQYSTEIDGADLTPFAYALGTFAN